MRKIIQIMPGHDPDVTSEFLALFDDGNIAKSFYVQNNKQRKWISLDHPPIDLFETKKFIENNYKYVMYVCYIPENGKMPDHYKVFGHAEFKNFCIITWNEIINIMSSDFPSAIKLNSNPIEKYDGYEVVQTWVMK